MRLLSLEDIIKGEVETYQITHSFLKGIHDNVPRAINVLLQLMYFTGPEKDINTLEGEFHSYVWHQYIQAPYSFRACYILYERGHYLNASILFRSLLESFIQCRYLFNHKDRVSAVWSGRKIKVGNKEKYIRIKDMFEEICPGYFDKYYGKQLSGFAHGKIAANIFRVKRKSPMQGETIVIPKFDVDLATYVINNIVALLFGYLNFFPKFFPEGFASLNVNLLDEYNHSKEWLQKGMNSHKKEHPRSLAWYKHMDKIIKD